MIGSNRFSFIGILGMALSFTNVTNGATSDLSSRGEFIPKNFVAGKDYTIRVKTNILPDIDPYQHMTLGFLRKVETADTIINALNELKKLFEKQFYVKISDKKVVLGDESYKASGLPVYVEEDTFFKIQQFSKMWSPEPFMDEMPEHRFLHVSTFTPSKPDHTVSTIDKVNTTKYSGFLADEIEIKVLGRGEPCAKLALEPREDEDGDPVFFQPDIQSSQDSKGNIIYGYKIENKL